MVSQKKREIEPEKLLKLFVKATTGSFPKVILLETLSIFENSTFYQVLDTKKRVYIFL